MQCTGRISRRTMHGPHQPAGCNAWTASTDGLQYMGRISRRPAVHGPHHPTGQTRVVKFDCGSDTVHNADLYNTVTNWPAHNRMVLWFYSVVLPSFTLWLCLQSIVYHVFSFNVYARPDTSRLPAYRLLVVVAAFLRKPSRIQAQACRVVVNIIAFGTATAPPRASKDDRISFSLSLAVRNVLKNNDDC